MEKRLRITPRARRLAEKHGLSADLAGIAGSAFRGGIGERDVRAFLETRGAAAGARVLISPLAARIASREGVDTATIAAAGGPGGKIMKADVYAALERAAATAAAEASAAEQPAAATGTLGMNGDKRIANVIPYTGVRRIIGERLAQSKFTAPHLYFTQKTDLSDLLSLRKKINADGQQKTSVTDYIARACVIALIKHPELNASLAEDRIERYANVNIGLATATPSGLIVPVIKNAQDLRLVEISAAAARLIGKARAGKLMPDEYAGGTFTISNLGMFGIENFTAIINPPESGILAVSSTKDEPVVITDANGEKSVAIRPMMNITLSVDHRLIDGLLAAQFVTEVKRLLENPVGLLL
ncbi:MAG: 2-oxo acid dehydrogenase subunit E2 [Clostridiales Family XIII bacterium]|jgi:pyruvate dehydrogenase E2 component (dihydrolipoamide acetyltransferase)|nr:2-oxo acid dehydrogenase subunit E2 [Clostridiales Family XIII bacterium]